MTDGKESSSIIDLTLISSKSFSFFKSCITLNESAVNIYQKKYYHVPIALTLNIEHHKYIKEVSKSPPYNYQAANWKTFKELIDEELLNRDLTINTNDSNKLCSE